MKRGGVWCYIFTYFYFRCMNPLPGNFFMLWAVGAWWGEPVLGAKKEGEKEESSLV
jgi:hypothetical protein